MTSPELPIALVLDYGGVICRTTFERQPLIERKLGLAPGTLRWRGPFDPDGDELWRDMLADRITSVNIGACAQLKSAA